MISKCQCKPHSHIIFDIIIIILIITTISNHNIMIMSSTITHTSTTMRKRQREQQHEEAPPPRSVQFNRTVKVVHVAYLVPLHADYDETAVQQSDIWYTSREYKSMTRRDNELIRSHQHRGSSSSSSSTKKDSLLGLETHAVRAYRRERMNAGIDAVLAAQEEVRREVEAGDRQELLMISGKYQESSHEAQEEARLRAFKLASAQAESLARGAVGKKKKKTTSLVVKKRTCSLDIDCPPPLSSSAGAGRWEAAASSNSPGAAGMRRHSLSGHRDSLALLATHKNTAGLRLPIRSACY